MKKVSEVWLVAGRGQDAPDLVHPPGDCRFRDAEDLRGLGMGELLAGDQHAVSRRAGFSRAIALFSQIAS